MMSILGIESSCDETAAAVVAGGRRVLSNVVLSSLNEHKRYGGVIPEIASRRQLEYIYQVVEEALSQADCSLEEIRAIAVTRSPGLIGSLLVGISFARALSLAVGKPLIEVDHIHAHLYSNFLNPQSAPQLPAIGLVVSGGHTSLFYVKDVKHYQLIGETLDDAAGEAYDKAARILGLGYPGGPVIDRLAQKGNTDTLSFSSSELPGTFNFSFSGIKTAVLYYHRDHHTRKDYAREDVAAAFQKSVVDILVKKCLLACEHHRVKTLLVGGGVAANSQLRSRLKKEASERGIESFFPPLPLCMDNAAMIAGLGYCLSS
jgi:N6-L-threonylcarbamoyladenine synthase